METDKYAEFSNDPTVRTAALVKKAQDRIGVIEIERREQNKMSKNEAIGAAMQQATEWGADNDTLAELAVASAKGNNGTVREILEALAPGDDAVTNPYSTDETIAAQAAQAAQAQEQAVDAQTMRQAVDAWQAAGEPGAGPLVDNVNAARTRDMAASNKKRIEAETVANQEKQVVVNADAKSRADGYWAAKAAGEPPSVLRKILDGVEVYDG